MVIPPQAHASDSLKNFMKICDHYEREGSGVVVEKNNLERLDATDAPQ